jgi:DNA-binding NtrC family response regulator
MGPASALAVRRVFRPVILTLFGIVAGLDLLLATAETPAVDLLLTDAVMPGMSGPTLAMTMIERYPALKVLVISGFTDHPLLTSTTTRFRLLAKPFRPDDLLRAVREQLDGH